MDDLLDIGCFLLRREDGRHVIGVGRLDFNTAHPSTPAFD